MSESKTFQTLAVASAATGVALCSGITVSLMAEISEQAMGHPVWTHELGDKTTTGKIHDALLAQFPKLPSRDDAMRDWERAAKVASEAYGDTLTVEPGTSDRSEGPMQSLARILDGGVRP